MKQLSAALLGCTVRIVDFSARRIWRRVRAAASRWYAFHSAAARKQLSARPTRRAASSRKVSAGIEGRISVLFRGRGMKRCLAEGRERFELLVGAAVFVNNLLIIASLLKKRSSDQRQAA